MTRRAIILFALVCALALGAPVAAGAASGSSAAAAISDCNDHSQLTAHYSPATLRAALAQMPVDVREYTDCYDVIERQLFSEIGHTKQTGAVTGTPAASSSGSGLPTWLLVVIVLLALAGVTFGALAVRRRSAVAEGPDAGGAAGPPPGSGQPRDRGSGPGPEDPGGDAGA